MSNINLADRGVWDDSALVNHWNNALAEYNKYHSIQAKGCSIDEVEKELEAIRAQWNDNKNETEDTSEPIEVDQEDQEEGKVDVDPVVSAPAPRTDETPSAQKEQTSISESKIATPSSQPAVPVGLGPQVLLGTVQDDGLQKLLMSWYYAGYYTGLYEGKQHQH